MTPWLQASRPRLRCFPQAPQARPQNPQRRFLPCASPSSGSNERGVLLTLLSRTPRSLNSEGNCWGQSVE